MYNRIMAKKNSVQKKKTTTIVILNILIKTLVAVAVIIFSFIIIKKTGFMSGGLDFSSTKKSRNKTTAPSQVNWFNSFKGIENVPDKNSKGGNSGFKYNGFNK